LKFGVIPPYGIGPVEDGGFASRFARLAEQHGFESLWVVAHVVMVEHYRSVYPYDPSGRSPFTADVAQPDPLIWLSYVAAATDTIRLATGVLNLPQRNPVILAKELASLDRLSGGRLELGIGIGWVREEAEAVGTTWSDRGRRADEYVAAMRTLWEHPISTFDGSFVRFERVVSRPKPMQHGGVPIVVGGHSEAAARRAGRLGDLMFPFGADAPRLRELVDLMKSEARACSRDPDAIEITTVGLPTRESTRHLADLGVDRLIVAVTDCELAAIDAFMDRFSREVMVDY